MVSGARLVEMAKRVLEYPYQTDKVVLLPYSEKHVAVFPEDFLGRLYFRLQEEHTLHRIFPGMQMNHMSAFVTYMSKMKGLVICCIKTETKPEPVGFGWLPEVDGVDGARKAAVGFGFFRRAWGTPELRSLSRMMLWNWHHDLKIDMLFGCTLRTNALAKKIAYEMGFELVGDIPMFYVQNGKLLDATLLALSKPKFEEVMRERHGEW